MRIRKLARLMEAHPICTALAAGAVEGLFVFDATVWMAAILAPVALVALWRANRCE